MDPLELLKVDENRVQPFLSKYWVPVCASGIGFLATCFVNLGARKPALSGIQKHIVAATTGWFAGTFVEEYRAGYLAERDAVLRHYIQLHPEDFPVQERKKYKDVLQTWIPIR